MKPRLSLNTVALAMFISLCLFAGMLSAAEVIVSKGKVEKAQNRVILTDDGKAYKVDGKTEYVRVTPKGEIAAMFTDLKRGTSIEMHQEKGAMALQKVRILSP